MDNEKILNMIAQAQKTLDDLKQEILVEHNSKPQTTGQTSEKPVFPHELESLVKIEDSGKLWTLTPTKFLGSENFSMILGIVKEYGGQYFPSQSKGQPGHFEIPK